MHVLLVDDELYYYKLLEKPLKDAGHSLEYAKSAKEALASISTKGAEIVIMDLRLPDSSGFDILERLRRDQRFSHVPLIVITVDNDLNNKLKAFELGADDYLVKPFQPEELVARLRILGNRGKALKIVQDLEKTTVDVNTTVALHSLRGGVGCSSIAVNLAIAYRNLWERHTLLVDAVLTAGQVAMMLDSTPRVTWEHYVGIAHDALSQEDLEQLVSPHKSGLNYVASPKSPLASDAFSDEFWRSVFAEFKQRNEFIVVDLPHDFSDMTIQLLNMSNWVLLVLAPEIGSLRAASSALEIYDRLGYPADKIKLVLNRTSSTGIQQAKLEKVLERPFDFVLPHDASEVRRALDFGVPFVTENPDLPISAQIENMAFHLSDEFFKNLPPALPSGTWKRVNKRLTSEK
ncbi:MAG TPA: response regulator [Anaerolineales bacterium]|nr:response regulator [Anaerolineales bacterium]